MLKRIKNIVKESLIVIIPTFIVGLLFIAGWHSGYHSAYKRGENRGFAEGYKCASNEFFEARDKYFDARDKYFEARIELRVALMDLLDYKLKLQEEKEAQ